MLKIIIVDDETEALDFLESHLKRYGEEHGYELEITRYNSPVKFMSAYKSNADIVFLDIDMPDMDGMSVARNIRKVDEAVSLIFVTNMAQFAIKGYEVDADDFMVKPVSYKNFETKIARVLKKHAKLDNVYVTVMSDGNQKYIPLDEIRYVEVQKHNLAYYTVNGRYSKRGTLKSEEALLVENGFARCNNYCLVNLRFVLGINGYSLHLSCGKGTDKYDELTVSHPRKKEFVRTLNGYLADHI